MRMLSISIIIRMCLWHVDDNDSHSHVLEMMMISGESMGLLQFVTT
jgi:hypothetical protein